jgi:hypothetical protein
MACHLFFLGARRSLSALESFASRQPSFIFGCERWRSALKPVVPVLFLSIFDVNPTQFFEINLLIVSPTVAKDERA